MAEALEQVPPEVVDRLQSELRSLAQRATEGCWPARGPLHHVYVGPYEVLVELNAPSKTLTVLRFATS